MKQSNPWSLSSLYKKAAPVLRPFGKPYAWLMRLRRERYTTGRLPSYRPACPCVSLGNIAFGGTGKTPLTAWLLAWAERKALRAVVLSRGYKGHPGSRPLLVQADTPAAQSGDEPLMLAQSFPGVPIVVFPKRAESARHAEHTFAPDLIILDDGMQHLAVSRDTDIVLLRPEDLEEDWNRVIPAGPWREGASALACASAFAMKAEPEDAVRLAPLVRQRLAAFGKPFFFFSLEVSGLEALNAPQEENAAQAFDCASYRGKPYLLLSGVGNPAGVEATATRFMGRPPVRHFDFDDHHPFDAADIQAVTMLSPVPLPVLCTAKDAVKLRPLAEAFGLFPVLVIKTEALFGPSLFCEHDFTSWWEKRWQQMSEGIGRVHG